MSDNVLLSMVVKNETSLSRVTKVLSYFFARIMDGTRIAIEVSAIKKTRLSFTASQ